MGRTFLKLPNLKEESKSPEEFNLTISSAYDDLKMKTISPNNAHINNFHTF